MEQDLLDGATLHDVALEHHRDVVGHVRHHAHVVRDEQDAGVELVLEGTKEVEDLGLHRDVEGRGGLVGDDHLGVTGQRHRDDDALTHAAREFVRVLLDAALGPGDADGVEQVDCAVPGLAAVGHAVDLHRFDQLVPDTDDRVQRGHGLLEHHRDPVAAQLAQFAGRQVRDDLVRDDRLALDARGLREEAERRGGGDGLAGTGFADQRHHFAGLHREGEALHRVDGAELGLELDVEVVELERRVVPVETGGVVSVVNSHE